MEETLRSIIPLAGQMSWERNAGLWCENEHCQESFHQWYWHLQAGTFSSIPMQGRAWALVGRHLVSASVPESGPEAFLVRGFAV